METDSLIRTGGTPAARADENPALIYLSTLAASGRAAVSSRLKKTCELVGLGDPSLVRWEGIRFQHLAAVRTKLLESGAAPATINLSIHAMRGISRAAFNLGMVNAEDFQRLLAVKGVRSERLPAGRALSCGELKKLVSVCSQETPQGKRDLAAIAVLYCGGLRRAELVSLDLADYNRETGELHVRNGKGRKGRTVHMMNSSRAALESWLTVRGNEAGPLFFAVNKGGRIIHARLTSQSIYKKLKSMAERGGIKSVSPHDMRRSFITDLLNLGADISTVQKLAGHASVTTTQRYDRRGEDSKRRAAALLHLPVEERGI